MSGIRCPKCGTALGKNQAGALKVRLPILVFRRTDDGTGQRCETACPGCKADVALPFTLDDVKVLATLAPVVTPPRGVRLELTPRG